MSLRSSSMEAPEADTPDTSLEVADTSNRRKSGRARQKPVLLSEDPDLAQSGRAGSAKRKLADRDDAQDDEAADESEEDDDGEDDGAVEGVRKSKKKTTKRGPSKPVPKKTKTSSAAPTSTRLPVRTAVNGVKNPAKPRKQVSKASANAYNEADGLFGQLFSRAKTSDELAAGWIAHWGEDQTEAMCALVNFIIRCTGCELQINVHDIEDTDNVVSKLTDLQEEYQALNPVEYPLVSKAKGTTHFRPTLDEYIHTLITAFHAQGLLYTDLSIIENIDVWVSTMSSSSIRPFRHTATVISLAISTTLCEVSSSIVENLAVITRQKDAEKKTKKKRVNEARVKELENNIADLDRRLAQNTATLREMYDSVFIHRYRDVDPKIRHECMEALGGWISTYPDLFFEGIYLRYLGWVLSDLSAPVRAEVVRQLVRLFENKDNVARLRAFTERFRPRLIEMAMRDVDLNIRVTAIELLELVRETELLEPDDVDKIGRLIFDSEPRIRKAVSGFFAENVNDFYETTLDEFGGQDGLLEMLGEEIEDDFNKPRMSWLKLKCTVETLSSYDAQDDQGQSLNRRNRAGFLVSESRLTSAARNVCEVLEETGDWRLLAGYLLFDFSQNTRRSTAADAAFKQRCKTTESEDIILLELLDVAVKKHVQDSMDVENERKGKKTTKQKDSAREAQNNMAVQLANMIPRLLKKYGSNPTTASPVIALGSIMNLEIFQELRQDSTAFASLLDDINKQFLSHGSQEVLIEASNALLHAQQYEELAEVTETKVGELWQDTIRDLRAAMASGLPDNLGPLSDAVRRITALSNAINCVDAYEKEARAKPSKKAAKISSAPALSILIDLLREPALDPAAGEEAVEILINSIRAVRSYYMWTTVTGLTQIEAGHQATKLPDISPFAHALVILSNLWPTASAVRIAAATALCDTHTLYARFRQYPSAQVEIPHLSTEAQRHVLQTFIAFEKQYARLAHKKLEPAVVEVDDDPASDPEDHDPIDSEDEEAAAADDDDSDGADSTDGNGNANDNYSGSLSRRKRKLLVAEEALCKLTYSIILAILARVLDHESGDGVADGDGSRLPVGHIRKRIDRNRVKLGGAFKETLALMDDAPPSRKTGGLAKKAKSITTTEAVATAKAGDKTASKGRKGAFKSTDTVHDDDDEEEEEDEDEERALQLELEEDLIEDDVDVDAEDGEAEAGAGAGAGEDEDDIIGD